jgi:hypothetical protein
MFYQKILVRDWKSYLLDNFADYDYASNSVVTYSQSHCLVVSSHGRRSNSGLYNTAWANYITARSDQAYITPQTFIPCLLMYSCDNLLLPVAQIWPNLPEYVFVGTQMKLKGKMEDFRCFLFGEK